MEDGKASRKSEMVTSMSVLAEIDPSTNSPLHQKRKSSGIIEEEVESLPLPALATKVSVIAQKCNLKLWTL